MKMSQFCVVCRSVKMTARNFLVLIFLSTLVAIINGYNLRVKHEADAPIPEECLRPPVSKQGHKCCKLPKERIWGNLRGSINLCLKKKQESDSRHSMRQEMADDAPETVTPEVSDVITPSKMPGESTPITNPSTTPGHQQRRGRPKGKKSLSERLKELFSSLYKEIKSTFDAIWHSVVIITDHLRRYSNDSCFMECVFEDQGFLLDKVVNKGALLDRLSKTLEGNEVWHKVAVAAVEICYQTEIPSVSNGTCRSGSEEIFRCVFREIFFSCPDWTQSDYCMSLREFYQKCPKGPPPQINDNHTTIAPPEEDMESFQPSTESERYTELE